jgi:hypothetical protein
VKAALDAALKRKRSAVTIIVNAFGRLWTEDGFRTSWDKAFRKTSLKDLLFHDLRGTAVTRLALSNCAVPEFASKLREFDAPTQVVRVESPQPPGKCLHRQSGPHASPPTPKNLTIKTAGSFFPFYAPWHPIVTMSLRPPFPLRPRLSMMLGMVNTSDTFWIGGNANARSSSGRRATGARAQGTTRTMMDEDEGEQHAAAGEMRPMSEHKAGARLDPILAGDALPRDASRPFSRAAHEIGPPELRGSRMRLPAWQLGINKVA